MFKHAYVLHRWPSGFFGGFEHSMCVCDVCVVWVWVCKIPKATFFCKILTTTMSIRSSVHSCRNASLLIPLWPMSICTTVKINMSRRVSGVRESWGDSNVQDPNSLPRPTHLAQDFRCMCACRRLLQLNSTVQYCWRNMQRCACWSYRMGTAHTLYTLCVVQRPP